MNSEDRVNVLLVDDKPENLLAMESVLAEPGLNLVSVQSAGEALRFLLIEEVALVLLDVQMPGLNGFELAELIREREKTQHTPIIFISAQSVDDQYVFKGYALGVVDYITKPFKPEILRSKVTFFTKLFRQNQQIKRQASLLEQVNVELDGLNSNLEARVSRRTSELEAANEKLEREVEIRRESEARLAIEHSITRTLARQIPSRRLLQPYFVLFATIWVRRSPLFGFWMMKRESLYVFISNARTDPSVISVLSTKLFQPN